MQCGAHKTYVVVPAAEHVQLYNQTCCRILYMHCICTSLLLSSLIQHDIDIDL